MERIQIGIIGAGRIGRVHAENIAKFVPQMEIKTVADPYMSPEAEAFLRDLRIPNLSRDADDILHLQVEGVTAYTATPIPQEAVTPTVTPDATPSPFVFSTTPVPT